MSALKKEPAGKKEPIVKKELVLLLVGAIVVLAAIAVAFYFLGLPFNLTPDQNAPAQNQNATASVNYDPASAIGGRIAESTSNPMDNVSLNPFSER